MSEWAQILLMSMIPFAYVVGIGRGILIADAQAQAAKDKAA